MILSDFCCPDHGSFELMVESPAPDDVPCPGCGASAVWVPFPVMGKVRMVEAHRGKADPIPGPLAVSTRELGEGMSMKEWREKREKVWREHDHKLNKDVARGY